MISASYRAKLIQDTHFRQWAARTLRERPTLNTFRKAISPDLTRRKTHTLIRRQT